MADRKEFISLVKYGWHKGFYNDEDFSKSLIQIEYTDFFDKPDDEDFLFDTAHDLLRGSCHHFAWAAQRVLGYQPYIIEQNVGVGFHVLCQVYKNRKLYYIDARGVTTSFDEFMTVAKEFVHGEFVIRPVEKADFDGWEKDDYNSEGLAFAEEFIREYRDCYTI
ncbi:MAG: hypothetical protein LUF27_04105 [Lachnospiraceae bacterium]|nr:hypothetical protein [Lachnospiraceae bacterium]